MRISRDKRRSNQNAQQHSFQHDNYQRACGCRFKFHFTCKNGICSFAATNGVAVVAPGKNSNAVATVAVEQSASTNQVTADAAASRTTGLKVAIPSTPLSSWLIVVIASVCGGVVAVLVLFLARTRKREPSLISRAVMRERINSTP
jgi:hypothetical protein